MRARRVNATLALVAVAALALPAPAFGGPLDSVGDAVDDVTGLVDPFGGGGPNVQDAIGGAAEGILDLIANAMVDGASWLLGAINSLIDSTTEVRITGISTACERDTIGDRDVAYPASCYEPVGWFGGAYGAMWTLAAIFALAILFIAAIDAVVRGQTHELIRLPLKVILAFALTAAAIAITGMLLQFTDEAANWIAGSGGRSAGDFLSSSQDAIEALKGEADEGDGEQAPVFVRMLVALAMALGALIVWIELLLRASAIFVGVFFLPLAIVAMVWPRTGPIFKRVAEILLALIFCKFGVVAVVALGGRAIVAAEGDVGQALAGATILLLACLMPILLLNVVHFAEGAWAMSTATGVGARAATTAPALATRGAAMMATASRNWGGRAWGAATERSGSRGWPRGPAGLKSVGSATSRSTREDAGQPRPVPSRASPAPHSRSETVEPTKGRPTVEPGEGVDATTRSTRAAGPPKKPQASSKSPPAAPSVRDRETGDAPAPPRVNPARRPPTSDPFEDRE